MATRHGNLEHTTIALRPEHMAVVKRLADEHFGGNVSALVRDLIATHPVTKSLVKSSPLAT